MSITVSVIIPCYQSQDTICSTLEHLVQQKTKFEYEILVIDSSTDATSELVKRQFSQVSLIELSKRTLAAQARNIGAKKAKGKFLAFLDSDCIVDDHWLQTGFDTLSKQYCGVGGPIENANPDSSISWAGYLLEFSEFMLKGELKPVMHIPSGNLFINKTVFEQIDGFPEDFKFAQEDRYFCWLLCQQTGKQFLFNPKIGVKHHHRIGLTEFVSHQFNIGVGGAEILKRTNLTGHRIIRHRFLMLGILPFLPFKKLSICLFRLVRYKRHLIIQYPGLIFLLFFGMIAWGIGFSVAIYSN